MRTKRRKGGKAGRERNWNWAKIQSSESPGGRVESGTGCPERGYDSKDQKKNGS